MGLAEKYIPHYTYNDWVCWEGKWELIEGVPFAMSPMPIPEHQRVAGEIRTELTIALRKSNCKNCKTYDPIDYKISDDTIFQPDVLVVCGQINKNYLDFPPALIVEIISPSTSEKDRGIKFDYYEREGVRYYLIVDVRRKSIEVYQRIDGRYQLQEAGDYKFTFEDDCTITAELNNVWENA